MGELIAGRDEASHETHVRDLDILELHAGLETHVLEGALDLATLLVRSGVLGARDVAGDGGRILGRSSPSDGGGNVRRRDLDDAVKVRSLVRLEGLYRKKGQ